jgi:hypothetical protein
LLGRDAASIVQPATLQSVVAILEAETDVDGLTLASDMGGRTEDNLELLEALLFGVRDRSSLRTGGLLDANDD